MTMPRAVLFDLLTALLDSWSVWNAAAGSEQAGRAWRAEYLRLTYGCGTYVAYEDLVRQAARSQGLDPVVADALESSWDTLPVWSGAQVALDRLAGKTRLGIVTNCSTRLGRLAAARLDTRWDVVITAEEGGFYKPHPRPYQLALETLGIPAAETAFVAGSGYDLIGTSAVGLRTYWHNRVGLSRPEGAPAAERESADLDDLVPWLEGFS
ncbi:HAD-IA family hydrolase [Tardiphaga sp. P5_C7]